jgi:hypothetical protein
MAKKGRTKQGEYRALVVKGQISNRLLGRYLQPSFWLSGQLLLLRLYS